MENLCIKSQINICKVCNNKLININYNICDVCKHNIELKKKELNDNDTISDFCIDSDDISTNSEYTSYYSDSNNDLDQNFDTFNKSYIKCTKIVLHPWKFKMEHFNIFSRFDRFMPCKL